MSVPEERWKPRLQYGKSKSLNQKMVALDGLKSALPGVDNRRKDAMPMKKKRRQQLHKVLHLATYQRLEDAQQERGGALGPGACAALSAQCGRGPPASECPVAEVDERSLPTAQAAGSSGNRPTRERATAAGFRLRAPGQGRKQSGVGKIRNAVERCPNFFAQFGRVARRLDRSARWFLGWVQLAACVMLIRSGFVR